MYLWDVQHIGGNCCIKFEYVKSRVFGWSVEEVQESYVVNYCGYIGIPLGICSYKIQRMRKHKMSIEQQRRLNQPMQEVVK